MPLMEIIHKPPLWIVVLEQAHDPVEGDEDNGQGGDHFVSDEITSCQQALIGVYLCQALVVIFQGSNLLVLVRQASPP